jgi:hypothetical protein
MWPGKRRVKGDGMEEIWKEVAISWRRYLGIVRWAEKPWQICYDTGYYSVAKGVSGSVVVRHYATNLKVAGLCPDEVDVIYLPNPSDRTMALGSTQPLTEMNTRNLKKKTWGAKGGRRVGLATLPPSVSRLSK